MKKNCLAILKKVLAISFAIILGVCSTACQACPHFDFDGNGKCDICSAALVEDKDKCDTCGKDLADNGECEIGRAHV